MGADMLNRTLERASSGHRHPPEWATTPDRVELRREHKPFTEPFYLAAFTVTGG